VAASAAVATRWQYTLKRALDVGGALFVLLLIAPLLPVIALWVLLLSGPPVLYRERRIGRHGRSFTVYKFRTLEPGTALERTVAPEDDHRITRAGLPLRRTRLDELPQIYNLLCGDMSLVGPRPMVQRHADALDSETRRVLLSVRPGVTDPASVLFFAEDAALAGRPDAEEAYLRLLLPAKARVQLDYLRHWNLFLDIRIICQTLARVWSPAARARSRQYVQTILSGREQ